MQEGRSPTSTLFTFKVLFPDCKIRYFQRESKTMGKSFLGVTNDIIKLRPNAQIAVDYTTFTTRFLSSFARYEKIGDSHYVIVTYTYEHPGDSFEMTYKQSARVANPNRWLALYLSYNTVAGERFRYVCQNPRPKDVALDYLMNLSR